MTQYADDDYELPDKLPKIEKVKRLTIRCPKCGTNKWFPLSSNKDMYLCEKCDMILTHTFMTDTFRERGMKEVGT